jgi:hypothetical protein
MNKFVEMLKESEGKNGYICFWNREKVEVYADTSYAAQQKAVVEFQKKTKKKVKGSDITVKLAEKDDKEVVHTAVD